MKRVGFVLVILTGVYYNSVNFPKRRDGMKIHSFRGRLLRIILLSLGLAVAAAALVLLAKAGIGIGCPFHKLTGLQCPGCGNSRAAMALLRLDFPASFRYNPLFLPQIGYIAWVYLYSSISYLKGKRFTYTPPVPALDVVFLVICLLWGVVRNFI